ncbi:unnamed protein product [Schistocephalus solidus]|uniref:C2H2-type domain-containing protein n=1 Tax=Schistocephalus solidus TaxID=70667 RepID=A0A183SJ18_SCHSO|nr:unnamed protein product [Schistocephalus solidus]
MTAEFTAMSNTNTPCTLSAPANLTATITNDKSPNTPDYSYQNCPYNSTQSIDQVSHLLIHRKEAGEAVPGAPTYSRNARLHCSRIFTHPMGLLGHTTTCSKPP